jgi:hypothetical protein
VVENEGELALEYSVWLNMSRSWQVVAVVQWLSGTKLVSALAGIGDCSTKLAKGVESGRWV